MCAGRSPPSLSRILAKILSESELKPVMFKLGAGWILCSKNEGGRGLYQVTRCRATMTTKLATSVASGTDTGTRRCPRTLTSSRRRPLRDKLHGGTNEMMDRGKLESLINIQLLLLIPELSCTKYLQ